MNNKSCYSCRFFCLIKIHKTWPTGCARAHPGMPGEIQTKGVLQIILGPIFAQKFPVFPNSQRMRRFPGFSNSAVWSLDLKAILLILYTNMCFEKIELRCLFKMGLKIRNVCYCKLQLGCDIPVRYQMYLFTESATVGKCIHHSRSICARCTVEFFPDFYLIVIHQN